MSIFKNIFKGIKNKVVKPLGRFIKRNKKAIITAGLIAAMVYTGGALAGWYGTGAATLAPSASALATIVPGSTATASLAAAGAASTGLAATGSALATTGITTGLQAAASAMDDSEEYMYGSGYVQQLRQEEKGMASLQPISFA